MKAFVIKAASKSEENFLATLLEKLGIASQQISAEDLEDFGLLQLMKTSDRTNKVSRSSVMDKLKT